MFSYLRIYLSHRESYKQQAIYSIYRTPCLYEDDQRSLRESWWVNNHEQLQVLRIWRRVCRGRAHVFWSMYIYEIPLVLTSRLSTRHSYISQFVATTVQTAYRSYHYYMKRNPPQNAMSVEMVEYMRCCFCNHDTMILQKPDICDHCNHKQCENCDEWLNP